VRTDRQLSRTATSAMKRRTSPSNVVELPVISMPKFEKELTVAVGIETRIKKGEPGEEKGPKVCWS
jgi:hypothetical protein